MFATEMLAFPMGYRVTPGNDEGVKSNRLIAGENLNRTPVHGGLSETLKSMIDGLQAVHDFKNFRVLFAGNDDDREKLRRMEELYPNPVHPVVGTHPVTGPKILFVNPQFTLRIVGMTDRESTAVIGERPV